MHTDLDEHPILVAANKLCPYFSPVSFESVKSSIYSIIVVLFLRSIDANGLNKSRDYPVDSSSLELSKVEYPRWRFPKTPQDRPSPSVLPCFPCLPNFRHRLVIPPAH